MRGAGALTEEQAVAGAVRGAALLRAVPGHGAPHAPRRAAALRMRRSPQRGAAHCACAARLGAALGRGAAGSDVAPGDVRGVTCAEAGGGR